MTGEEPPVPAWDAMDAAAVTRWIEVLDTVADMLPGPAATIVVDGPPVGAEAFADRLVVALRATGQACARLTDTSPFADEDDWRAGRDPGTTTVADGPRWRSQPPTARWDLVIWLRSPVAVNGDGEHGADIVLDLHDPAWPLIRRVSPALTVRRPWYVTESRAFFGRRASTWDTRFGDDLPAYAAAVAEAGLRSGDTVLDVGCGTGRALPALRALVGPGATVVGLDLTPQMLAVAREKGRDAHATLVLADARHLPVADRAAGAVLAAGLVMHLPDLEAGLAELGRVTRPRGRLVLFHPSGRVALAARHGRTLRPDDPLAEQRLAPALTATGWRLDRYDDASDRFLALATRAP